jgi:hypothetical protein
MIGLSKSSAFRPYFFIRSSSGSMAFAYDASRRLCMPMMQGALPLASSVPILDQ